MVMTWLKARLYEWRGVLAWLIGMTTFIVLSAVAAYCIENSCKPNIDPDEFGHRVLALTVTIDMLVFTLMIVFFFFFVFRGTDATKNALENVITYSYAFIAFSLTASFLPFVILPHVPGAIEIMRSSPIGILKGCSMAAENGKLDTVPTELRCGIHSDQWIVNIGGLVVVTNEEHADTVKLFRTSLGADGPQARGIVPEEQPLASVQGGLVVPLYVVVLALMGATVSMTRRVPEFQRRMTSGDPEFMSFDAVREAMVFQIMQVASAPLIALTSYYIFRPDARASTIVLAFASGFSSETILLFIRAGLEKIRPNIQVADSIKATHVSASPDRLDFGDVKVGTTVMKSVAITNPTTIDLTVTSTNCSGEFTTPPNFPLRVPAGSSIAIAISFAPASDGAKSGVLTITDNAVGSPRSISLSGSGVGGTAPN